MDQPRSKATVECSYKVRDELCRLFSPVYNVSIDDVADIVNVLNIIKADCAQTPEKFRLLIGLLCQVDLSVANIEEHYEQLLIKNRIFHLLRMHPEVAHPVLDVIARATNRCCPLTTMPRTVENQDKRCPAGVGLEEVIKSSTSTKSNLVLTTALRGTTNPCTISAPRLSQAFFAATPQQKLSTVSSNGQSLASPQQPAAFDQSRKLYTQVPLSFHQSSLPGCSGIVNNSSGARESPSDIQKRILLQQQRHLRQQLEMLQAQRLKETSCVKNLSFDGQTWKPRNTPSIVTSEIPSSSIRLPEKMESSTTGCSTTIGQSRLTVKPIRARRIIEQPIKIIDGKGQRISEVQALDLSSSRRREQEVFNLVNSDTKKGGEAGPKEVVPQALFETSNPISKDRVSEEQSVGLTLSHVGQHCIMVSVGDKSKETGARSHQQVQVEAESAKHPAKKQKKGKSTRAVVINVQKLCHMHDTRHKNKTRDQTLCPSVKALTASADKHNKQGDSSSTSQCHDESSDETLTEGSPTAQDRRPPTIDFNQDQSLNKNNNGITADPVLTGGKIPSKRKHTHRNKKSGKRKRRRSRNKSPDSGEKTQGDFDTKSRKLAHELMPSDKPLDLSCALSTPSQHFASKPDSLKATNAKSQPPMWCRKQEPANDSSAAVNCQGDEAQQTGSFTGPSDDSDLYMLYAGCDDEGWYQSHSDEAKSARVSRSSSLVTSPMTNSESFLERFVQERLQPPPPPPTAEISNMPRAAATAAKVKRKRPKTRSRTDKQKRKKKH